MITIREEIEEIKFICVNNTTHIFKDGSTDRADQFLTLDKIYVGFYGSDTDSSIFISNTDLGGFPFGHQWFRNYRFKEVYEIRKEKLDNLGI